MTMVSHSLEASHEIVQFRNQIIALMGIEFDESKFPMLGNVLRNRLAANKLDHTSYMQWLSKRPEEEIRVLARELTVTETYFLRNIDQFNAFINTALSACIFASNGTRKINLLSAGCASGDEPYSLAIALQEYAPQFANIVTITAFDLNPVMLQKAARATYSEWSLRDLPGDMKKRWFKQEGDQFVLSDVIRRAVNFESRNLAEDSASFWIPGRFDIVFCRNILMYFTNANAQAAVGRIARSLTPGGYLFLGHAETLRGLSNDFHLCQAHNTFFYQRKEHITLDKVKPGTIFNLPIQLDTSWVDEIRRAFERIQNLNPSVSPVTVEDKNESPDLQHVLDSLHTERYSNSLNQLDNLPAEHANDPDVLLLKAISLCHSGARAEAERVCNELLKRDDCNAGAHYVLALCKEGDGHLDDAEQHNQAAVYLDQQFAMPRLHLGLLMRRKGERLSAQHHLKQALDLLQQEETSRILLFGGGFKREALMNLCRAELAAMGEHP